MDATRKNTLQTYEAIWNLYAADYGTDQANFDVMRRMTDMAADRGLSVGRHADLGSGPGNVVDYLLGRGMHSVDAVDFSPSFASFLRDKYADTPAVSVIESDMLAYMESVGDGTLSTVTASYSVIHIPDGEVDRLFADIASSLVPGGLFVMSAYRGTYKGPAHEPYQTHADPRLPHSPPLTPYLNCFTEPELGDRLTRAGLTMAVSRTYFLPASESEFAGETVWVLAEKRA